MTSAASVDNKPWKHRENSLVRVAEKMEIVEASGNCLGLHGTPVSGELIGTICDRNGEPIHGR